MKKYYITRMSYEIKNRSDFKPGCTFAPDVNPERIEEHETESDALYALSQYFTEIDDFQGHVGKLYRITEYWLETAILDDDGDEIETDMPEVSEPKYWYAVWSEDMGNDWSNGSWFYEDARNMCCEGEVILKINDREKIVEEEIKWEDA